MGAYRKAEAGGSLGFNGYSLTPGSVRDQCQGMAEKSDRQDNRCPPPSVCPPTCMYLTNTTLTHKLDKKKASKYIKIRKRTLTQEERGRKP